MKKVIERRLEFLKLEAMGMSLCEIVKELAPKWHKTERSIYNDAETRKTWQPVLTQLFELDKARLMMINRKEHLYRESYFQYQHAGETQKPVYLKLCSDLTNDLVALLGIESVKEAVDKKARAEVVEEDLKMLEGLAERKMLTNG